MIGILIAAFLLLPMFWFLGIAIKYSLDSMIYKFGDYTSAYRCDKCDSVHMYCYERICSKCGYEVSTIREIGKFHCRISKLRLKYYWESKNG